MNNKKSLLQDSLQELENIKNESLELAKEQLINESADLLEKKSAELFEKLIAGEDIEEGKKEESIEEESFPVNEILEKLKNISEGESDEEESDEEDMSSDEEESDEEESDEEEMDLDSLRKAAEEHGFKLVQADSDEEDMESDEEEMDSDEEDMESDDEEDIEFGDEESDDEEFSDVDVDDKVLAEAFSNKKINRKKQVNEGAREAFLNGIQMRVQKNGARNTAVYLIDRFLSDLTNGGVSSSDLSDTSIFANGVDEIEALLETPSTNNILEAMKIAEEVASEMLEDEGFGLNESLKRNNTKMRNTKKQVLKDLRDVSFNKLVEAYYNMDEEDSFVVKEDEYMDDDSYGMEDDEMPDYSNIGQLEEYVMDEDMYDEGYDMEEGYGMEDEEVVYEIDMPEGNYGMESMSDEGYEMTDEDINEMLSEMDIEETMHDAERASGMNRLQERQWTDKGMRSPAERVELKQRNTGLGGKRIAMQHKDEILDMDESMATDTRDFYVNQGIPKGSIAQKTELEEMFEEMSMEELEEMNQMLQEDGDGDDNGTGEGMSFKGRGDKFKVNPSRDYEEQDLTEAEIEEMLASMKEEEEIEESSAFTSQTKVNRGNRGGGSRQGVPERRSGMLSEEDDEDVESLKEQLKKLKQENKSLNEGFVNKVKSLENKVYDVTISALKAGFVNKFLLEHPLRENEKLEIIHRFSNAQTKEQIKETYVSLTNEFAKKQTVKDGSMLNESVQNKVSKIHRTDNVVVTEKNLINENDESNRFKQLLNYNFGKKK